MNVFSGTKMVELFQQSIKKSKKSFLRLFLLIGISLLFLSQAQGLPKWTIMIYLDGDNNLERYAIDDFFELSSVGSTSQVNLLVQFDRGPGYDTRYGNWTNTQRFKITQNMEPTISNAVSDWGDGIGGREVNMGDPHVLHSFVKWAKDNYPAEHYALILWDHGDGWRSMSILANSMEQQLKYGNLSHSETAQIEKTLKQLKRKINARRYQKSVCFDDTSFDELTLKEIADALSYDNCFIDILGFDACLMGMVEVAYEIRNCANYMVASEETIMVRGFPYDTISRIITSQPLSTPEEFAILIVQKYAEYYGQYSSDTLSAVNLSYTDQLFDTLNNLCQSAIEIDNQWIYLYASLLQTPHFDDEDYKDLKIFIEQLSYIASNQQIINQTNDIINTLNLMIIANFGLPVANGLSIYVPEQAVDINYNSENLSFAEGLWPQFLNLLLSSDLTKGFTRLISEDFSSGLPANWTIVDGNNDGKTWTTANPKKRNIQNLSEPFMIADSGWAGRVWMNEQLITQSIIINPVNQYILMFDHYFLSYGSEIADIDIKVNNNPWQNILQYQYQDTSGKVIISLNQYIIESDISYLQIRWNYKDAYDEFYWAIDNVYLLMESINPSQGDINRDTIVDISDVILCLRMSIGLEITINGRIYQNPYPEEIIELTDLNNDNSIDISDVILILRLSLNMI